MYLDHADLFALCGQIVNNFFQSFTSGTHSNNNAFCIGSTVVVEQLVVAAGQLVDFVHVFFYNTGQCIICAVASFAVLEESVTVLNGGTDGGMFGGQSVISELLNSFPVQQLAQVFVVQNFDLLQLVRSAEAIKEVLEGDGALDCSQVRNRCQVHTFLNGSGSHLCPAGLTAAHYVGMVTEDGDGVGTDGTCGNVHNTGQHGTCHTIHRRNHQQQTLRCGVGRGQRTGFQRAVHCTCRTGFRLHFNQLYGLTEQVFLAVCRPFVNMVCHGAGRSDGVNGCNFGKCVGNIRSRFVAVHCFEDFILRHNVNSSHNIFYSRVCRPCQFFLSVPNPIGHTRPII